MAFLQGFTVLDLASVGPAARASRILADYGMDVIKIAPVAAKGKKQVDPVYHAYGAGRGTRKIRLDLKSEEGKEVVYKLAKQADVVIESYRPGVAKRLGVGYEDLKAHNPQIVYCSTSGYGQSGPYSQWVGHDINYLAVGGFLACSGKDSKGRPAIPGATVADSAGGGMQAALSIISALLNRSRSDEGAYLDVSISDGVLNLTSLYIDQYFATGVDTRPNSAVLTGKYAWYGVYETADGKYLSVGAIESHFFKKLCRLLELQQYSDSQYDDAKQDEMKSAFEERFLTQDRDYWVMALSGNDTCVAPVLSIPEVTANEHFQDRQAFMQACHFEEGDFQQLGPVLAGGERSQPVHHVRPGGTTDTEQVLTAAGFNEQEIEQLKLSGSVE